MKKANCGLPMKKFIVIISVNYDGQQLLRYDLYWSNIGFVAAFWNELTENIIHCAQIREK